MQKFPIRPKKLPLMGQWSETGYMISNWGSAILKISSLHLNSFEKEGYMLQFELRLIRTSHAMHYVLSLRSRSVLFGMLA